MNQSSSGITHPMKIGIYPSERSSAGKTNHLRYSLPLLLALAVDLITPILIWKGVIPDYLRWISHGAVLLMLIGAYTRMMAYDRIPLAFVAIIAISAIGMVVAMVQGQGIAVTAWGWWIMFQFPMVGIYAYLHPVRMQKLPNLIRIGCISILGLQVLVQIVQYLTGEVPGDNLAGSFGEHGTTELIIFVIFTLCVALGHFLTRNNWKPLLIVLLLGGISSAFGEVKIFPFAAVLLGGVAFLIFAAQQRKFGDFLLTILIFGIIISAFFVVYDAVVVPARGTRSLSSYLNIDTLSTYLGSFGESRGERFYSQQIERGRNYALQYGWDFIHRDTLTLWLGIGLGGRSESVTLGLTGEGFQRDTNSLATGTSLLVFMQEFGLSGLIMMSLFTLLVSWKLIADIRKDPASNVNELRYALLFFTLLWPLWFYYQKVWTFRVPMLIYWSTLGFVLRKSIGGYDEGVEVEEVSRKRRIYKD